MWTKDLHKKDMHRIVFEEKKGKEKKRRIKEKRKRIEVKRQAIAWSEKVITEATLYCIKDKKASIIMYNHYRCRKKIKQELVLKERKMPQIDKVTFISTVYWLIAFYLVAYIDVAVNSLYGYLAKRKLKNKKRLWTQKRIKSNKRYVNILVSTIGL
jgi:hypothetical protein